MVGLLNRPTGHTPRGPKEQGVPREAKGVKMTTKRCKNDPKEKQNEYEETQNDHRDKKITKRCHHIAIWGV